MSAAPLTNSRVASSGLKATASGVLERQLEANVIHLTLVFVSVKLLLHTKLCTRQGADGSDNWPKKKSFIGGLQRAVVLKDVQGVV